MKITEVLLKGGAAQTGKVMHRLVRDYYLDMMPFASLPLTDAFQKIAEIPFRPDPEGHELVQRPLFTLRDGGDCDDKAICMAAYGKITGYRYRFRAVGAKRPGQKSGKILLTHVWAELKIDIVGEKWIICDCTYAHNILGQQTVNYDRSEFI